jgi:hypothetical protein
VGHSFVEFCRAWREGKAAEEVTSRERARRALFENMLRCRGKMWRLVVCRYACDIPFITTLDAYV